MSQGLDYHWGGRFFITFEGEHLQGLRVKVKTRGSPSDFPFNKYPFRDGSAPEYSTLLTKDRAVYPEKKTVINVI